MDSPIHVVHARMQELEALAARRERLAADVRRIQKRLARLEERAEAEDADVRAIERGGFVELMKNLVEPREERLTREREEALRAALTRDRARAELADVQGEVAAATAKLVDLEDVRAQYARLLAMREQALANATGPIAEELARITRESEELAARRAERTPMLASGREAGYELSTVVESMERAISSGRADMFGVPFAGMSKYQHLDTATRRLGLARTALRRFAQLSGRRLSTNGVQLQIPELLRFFDRWGSNDLFVDWSVQSKVSSALGQVRDLQRDLAAAKRQLEKADAEDAEREAELAARREELLRGPDGT